MTIFCLGSINADYFYSVPHIPKPGETLAAVELNTGLGGKGANQSVAAALAGATVVHVGAVGADGAWATKRMDERGVDISHVRISDRPTAHAIINVAKDGENAIVIFPGANLDQSDAAIKKALDTGGEGDLLILQNETSHQVDAARYAHEQGLSVIYSAAPFDVEAVQRIMPYLDILVVNEVEAEQLTKALDTDLSGLPVEGIVLTKGAKGAEYHVLDTGEIISVSAVPVSPVDTTGAGDTFLGYFVAALDEGAEIEDALKLAAKAAALKVTRPGTADAIPSRAEVDAFG